MSDFGQLIITGFNGVILSDNEKEFLENEDIGGVILFSKNYESPAQLAELVNSIQNLRREYPLIISVDHEGGRVIRFKRHFTQFPAMREMSKLHSPKICYHIHKIMAEELSACGVNLNFSPVCDILTNQNNKVIGDRAFGEDADTVSKYISSAIRGFQTNGLLACAKHFPGHGSSTKDSHFDLPIIKTSLDQLKDREFIPFIKAIKSRVEFVMMAHIIVDEIDSKLPCSLSKKAHEILRNEFKYSKIIVSDDMQMKAITDHYSTPEAALMALKAGTDMLVYRDMDQAELALEGIKKGVKDGKIRHDALKQSMDRVKDCKKRNLREYKPVYIPGLANKINSKASQVFYDEIMGRISEKNSQ